MIAHAVLPGVGQATNCVASASHAPVPLRFVWHHIQPRECGGPTEAPNLVPVCDSCHYSIHRLLFHLARGLQLGPVPRHAQLALAERGLAACQLAGTVADIPNEG